MNTQKELTSILQRGSWFQVCFMNGNHLETITVQGFQKTLEACKRLNIVHTPGAGFMVTSTINERRVMQELTNVINK